MSNILVECMWVHLIAVGFFNVETLKQIEIFLDKVVWLCRIVMDLARLTLCIGNWTQVLKGVDLVVEKDVIEKHSGQKSYQNLRQNICRELGER